MALRIVLYLMVVLSGMCLVTGLSASNDEALLDKFVRPPLIAAPTLSSDGHFLSGLKRQGDASSHLSVWHIDSGFEHAEELPYSRNDIHWMAWVGGGRLLVALKENGLVLYDAHLKRLRPLIENGGPRPGDLVPFLLSPLHSDPTNILMQWEDPAEPGYPAVYKVNAMEGTSQKIVSAWRPIVRWWVSPEGEVKLGEGYTGRKQRIYGRRKDGGWHQISKLDFFKGPARNVLTVETGGVTALVLSAHASDTRELWRMHTATGEMLAKLAGHPRYDISSALINPVSDLAVGASYIDVSRRSIIWQAQEKEQMENAAKRLGVGQVELMAASRDGRRLLYRVRNEYRPSQYHLYDQETDTLVEIPTGANDIDLPRREVETVDIPILGMKRPMSAVLSQPDGGATGKAIVLVHGGPVRRVSSNYSTTVAWLNANGYSVLQPNFRGSSGFGEKWRRAGYAEWGRHMQRDVRSAAEWLVSEGIADKGAMCVMGGSYGGYAALMSSIMDDDLFACAVSLNGVTSLPHLLGFLDTKRFSLITTPRIRGRLSERTLRRRSPLFRVDLVRMPVLLLHATQDQNVPFEHSALMAAALSRLEKPHEFVVLEGAEHVLWRTAHRRLYLKRATDFINKHLP